MLDREFIDFQAAVAGEYSLERELGRGGMGVVYLAREVQLDRLVAIKVLPQALAVRDETRQRFLREARMAASLSHPNIVPIHRVGEASGFVFFAMAYVNGETLGERLRARGPLAPGVAIRLLREVAWALSYAHERGIVHRDIKPDNILIEAETGRALVTDFGIARGAEDAGLSDPGRVMGTAHFMSPEQAAGETLDGRSDLYALGVVGYLATTGTLPFDAPSVPALLIKQLNSEAPAVASVAVGLPRGLAAAIDRCLRKTPADRFATGKELADALDSVPTSPARARLPLALRVWAQAQDPLRPLYVVWSGMFTMGLLSQIVRGYWGGIGDVLTLLGFDLLPLVPITLFHARKTYQALSAGYSLRDLRSAMAMWQQERREELTFDFDRVESGWARVMRIATYVLGGGAAGLMVMGVPGSIHGKVVFGITVASAALALTASNVFGVRLVSKRLRSRFVGAIRSRIWNSRLGEWAAKLLAPRRRKGAAPDLDYRPTEMALSVAAADLYAALPQAFRDDLPDLPAIVERLELHAAAARARVDELDALLSVGQAEGQRADAPGSTVAARDAAKRRLAESVAGLEAIRLDLLRLHGGAVDLRPITTVLEGARELGEQLDRLAEARREADAIVAAPLAIDLRPRTPA